MKHQGRDKSLDTLLDLDGEIIVVDPLGKHWVRFSVTKVEPTPEPFATRVYARIQFTAPPPAESNFLSVNCTNQHPSTSIM